MIEKKELRIVVNSIYELLYDCNDLNLKKFADDHSNEIFKRFDTDQNKYITIDEFVNGCLSDTNLLKLLAPNNS